jgi:hypothetical protein
MMVWRKGTVGDRLLLAAVVLAVAAPIFARGGYPSPSRSLFIALAGAALLLAVAASERFLRSIVQTPAALGLAAAAVFGAASAAWSLEPSASLRWAALVAAYAALAIAAGVLALGPWGSRPLVVAISLLGVVAAVIGITAAAIREEPFAELLGGRWRVGGTLEYPPALGLLEVSALPGLLGWMTAVNRPGKALLGAAGAATAAAALALTTGRTEVALGCVILVVAWTWPGRTVRAPRSVVGAAGLFLVAAGTGAYLIGGAATDGMSVGWRLLAFTAVIAAVTLAWLAVISLGRGRARYRASWRLRGAAGGLVATAVVAFAAVAATTGTDQRELGGFTHGRTEIWRAGLDAAGDRPLIGAGADAFYAASRSYQGMRPARFAHNLPLELLVELGIGGLLLAITLYVAGAWAIWMARASPDGWLLGPAVAAFLASNLLDWTWHMTASGAVFSSALGGLIAASRGSEKTLGGRWSAETLPKDQTP